MPVGRMGNLSLEDISSLEDDQMMPLLCLKTKYHYPVTQHHIPQEWNTQLHHCKNLKTHNRTHLFKLLLDL